MNKHMLATGHSEGLQIASADEANRRASWAPRQVLLSRPSTRSSRCCG